jgi:hypothetical protein
MRVAGLVLVLLLGLASAIAGYFALVAPRPSGREGVSDTSVVRPVWTEVKWPFPIDQWGTGRAFACKAADCGSEVTLYVRAKLGSCNCTTGIADDGDLDRMSDFDLIGGEVSPVGGGQPVTVGWMKGRSRSYTLAGRNSSGKSAVSIAFNDRCDMVVATALLPYGSPTPIEASVLEFLNSRTVLDWAQLALGI